MTDYNISKFTSEKSKFEEMTMKESFAYNKLLNCSHNCAIIMNNFTCYHIRIYFYE